MILMKYKIENKAWSFVWILYLAEDSHEISSLIFSEKKMKKYLWISSAAVVIGTLRVKSFYILKIIIFSFFFFFRNLSSQK